MFSRLKEKEFFSAAVENLFNAFSPLGSISIQTLGSHTEATC